MSDVEFKLLRLWGYPVFFFLGFSPVFGMKLKLTWWHERSLLIPMNHICTWPDTSPDRPQEERIWLFYRHNVRVFYLFLSPFWGEKSFCGSVCGVEDALDMTWPYSSLSVFNISEVFATILLSTTTDRPGFLYFLIYGAGEWIQALQQTDGRSRHWATFQPFFNFYSSFLDPFSKETE